MAKKKECTGTDKIFQGIQKTVNLCRNACKGKASMFIYGLAPSRCNKDGCQCRCEMSSKNGMCTMTAHSGYNLYGYKTGEIVITIIFFSLLIKNFRIWLLVGTEFESKSVNVKSTSTNGYCTGWEQPASNFPSRLQLFKACCRRPAYSRKIPKVALFHDIGKNCISKQEL